MLNHTQALCLILTTQTCVVLTQDHVLRNTKHIVVLKQVALLSQRGRAMLRVCQ